MMVPSRGHRRSLRVPGYDYSQPGAYFVTICTHGKDALLGKVVDGTVHLSEAGQIVQACWEELPTRYPEMVLDAFVVMPNHLHGIVVIAVEVAQSQAPAVGAIHELPLPQHVQRRRMLLPRAVGYFKRNAAKRIKQLRGTPGVPVWQRNYYERVIRNERELAAVREYIALNPLQWELDPEHVART